MNNNTTHNLITLAGSLDTEAARICVAAVERIKALEDKYSRYRLSVCMQLEFLEGELTSQQATLDAVENIVMLQTYHGHKKGNDCNDYEFDGKCSMCDTNESLGKALTLISKEKTNE